MQKIIEKKKKLRAIYARFERDVSCFKSQAVCELGCTSCCINVGNIDVVTLEAFIIEEAIRSLPEDLRSRIRHNFERNTLHKEKGDIVSCALLDESGPCLLYDVRPFSCRQLYSVLRCEGKGATVHRQAVDLARRTVREIQLLDDTGYSGHLSFVLQLFENSTFRENYIRGAFYPEQIREMGKKYRLSINRFVK